MRNVLYLSRRLIGEPLAYASALAALPDLRVLCACEAGPRALPTSKLDIEELTPVALFDFDCLLALARRREREHGPLTTVLASGEPFQLLAARLRERLELPGTPLAIIERMLDKSRSRARVSEAGLACVPGRRIGDPREAWDFVAEHGFPVVLKPTWGKGGSARRIADPAQLSAALAEQSPTPTRASVIERPQVGREHCYDTITLAGRIRVESIACYQPSILEAQDQPDIQWRCWLPREILTPEYAPLLALGRAAVRALEFDTGFTHMEAFLDHDQATFVEIAPRPGGVRISRMLGLACEEDLYLTWAELMIEGRLSGEWVRRHAVGTVYLRSRVARSRADVRELETRVAALGELVIETRLPAPGPGDASSIVGDGFVTLRDPSTARVVEGLAMIARP